MSHPAQGRRAVRAMENCPRTIAAQRAFFAARCGCVCLILRVKNEHHTKGLTSLAPTAARRRRTAARSTGPLCRCPQECRQFRRGFNDDVLAFKDPGFQRTDMCTVIPASSWNRRAGCDPAGGCPHHGHHDAGPKHEWIAKACALERSSHRLPAIRYGRRTPVSPAPPHRPRSGTRIASPPPARPSDRHADPTGCAPPAPGRP